MKFNPVVFSLHQLRTSSLCQWIICNKLTVKFLSIQKRHQTLLVDAKEKLKTQTPAALNDEYSFPIF